jgi:succinate dehydrogenase / fumarate reductase flavoprotein subunit
VAIKQQPMAPMREDLLALFDIDELNKYYTEAELPPAAGTAQPVDSEETRS